jgi:hypothetical protein
MASSKLVHLGLFLALVFSEQLLFASDDSQNTVADPFVEATRLLKSKKDPSRCDLSSGSALMRALTQVESLNQSTYNLNQETLLHLAVLNQCAEAVHWLLAQGADWRIRNSHRMNAFDLAVRQGNPEILGIFTEKLSGAPVNLVSSKTKIAVKPLEVIKRSQFDIKVGFSLANVSNEQIINLNGALKGLYQIDSRTVFKGRSEVFYAKAEQQVTTFRYLVEGKVLRENLFEKSWDGALNLKAEGYPHINTVDVAALVDKTWNNLDKSISLNASVGPGVRYIARTNGESDVEPIYETRQGLKWKPNTDLIFLKGGQYTISEDWTYTDGRSGYSSVLEVSGKHKLNDHFAAGITYKYWKTSLLDESVNDSQILFELSYQTEKDSEK